MRNQIYIILLFILHRIADFFETLRDVWVLIKMKMLPPSNGKISDFSEIVKRTQALPKLPKHITILLGNEEPSYKDLTNIVLWCIAAGIPFISFYDHKGLLRKSETLLKAQVEDEKNVGDHIIWHNSKGAYKNGYIGRRIHVKILSPIDGRAQFAEVCKTLAQQDVNIEKINIQSLDSYLRDHYEFPDPDLGIYCGKTFSLYNYPPWQISVTEFLNIKSHHNIHHLHFINILSRYSKCEQRLGK